MTGPVTPLLIATPVDWDRYILTDDDMARLLPVEALADRAYGVLTSMADYQGINLPWAKSNASVRLRRGRVSVWAGVTHHGKSQLLKQLSLHLIRHGETVCVASLEEQPDEGLAVMAQMALGASATDRDALDIMVDWARTHLWFYDQQGMVTSSRILALMAYAAQERGVTHMVIDSLMRLGIASDDYEAQRVFLNRVTGYARALNVHVHLVCHVRKASGETAVPNLLDVRGAGAIVDQADNVFVVWRDKRADRPVADPSGMLVVDKQRGRPNWLGRIHLWYHPDTGQFVGGPADMPQWYLPGERWT